MAHHSTTQPHHLDDRLLENFEERNTAHSGSMEDGYGTNTSSDKNQDKGAVSSITTSATGEDERHQEEVEKNPVEADKRHVDFNLSKDDSTDALHRLALRESSSAFLASLTSASELSSPLTSPFPSSDSLQSSHAGKGPGRFNSIDTSSSYHHEVTREDRLHATMPDSPADTTSSSSTSKQLDRPDVSNSSSILSRSVDKADQTVAGFDGTHEDDKEMLDTRMKTHRVNRGRGSSTSIHSHSKSLQDGRMSLSPSRLLGPSPAVSGLVEPSDKTPTENLEPFSWKPTTNQTDEAFEESHSKTPLLQRTDLPAPKETDQLVKDSSVLGNKLINDYEVMKRLGSGAHGTVKLARNIRSNQHVAIKVVRRYPKKGRLGRHETPEDKVKKEVAVLKKARHPHIVSLLEVIDDPSYQKVYLILEYVERGEINWRKETERELAAFEMYRIRREIAGNDDEAAEAEALSHFNDYLLQRYLEKTKSFPPDFGKGESNEGADSHGQDDSFQDQPLRPSESHEYNMFLNPNQIPSQPSSRPTSRPASEYGDLISPLQTLRVPSRASSHSPHPLFENELSGSMYGSYVEDDVFTHASELDHRRAFDDLADPTEWNADEEEYRYVPCLTISEARDVFRDTVLGLEFLHFHGIIHRDIKPANLLWTHDFRVKISDFGVSYLGRPMQGEGNDGSDEPTISHADMSIELAKTVGTPAFYAPELCDPDLFDAEKNITRPHITGQVDVWALGVTLYAMIFGRLPFYDLNEFAMYEKIAKHEVFIPSKRLRGVEAEAKVPMNCNKREEHVVQYENVDDELRDLLRRLLIKDPSKRITIKEVKHHPWVLRGVSDQLNWMDVTDPSYKGSRKIEISQEDIQEAIVPRGWVEGFKSGIRRLTSVVRGRGDSRKRAESSAKASSTSVGAAPRSDAPERERHRLSLHGDETIFSALRASRENAEHPLSQSTLASPVHEDMPTEFVTPISYLQSQSNNSSSAILSRPGPNDRMTSTAESIVTIRPADGEGKPLTADDGRLAGRDSAGSSSSSISKIIDGTREATRRIASRVRSREPGKSSRDDSGSSRASSADNLATIADNHHVQPTVAVSPLVASGHLHHPMMLGGIGSQDPGPSPSPELGRDLSLESVQSSVDERGRNTQARNRANTAEWAPQNASDRQESPGSQATEPRIPSSASSDDRITSASSEPFSPLPSNGSGASIITPPLVSPSGYDEMPSTDPRDVNALLTTGETITPALMKKYHAQQHQASAKAGKGRSDEVEDGEDEGSDDEGIVMRRERK